MIALCEALSVVLYDFNQRDNWCPRAIVERGLLCFLGTPNFHFAPCDCTLPTACPGPPFSYREKRKCQDERSPNLYRCKSVSLKSRRRRLPRGRGSLGSYFRKQACGHGDGQNNHLVCLESLWISVILRWSSGRVTGPSGGQKPKLLLFGVLLLDCLSLGLLPKFLLPESSSLPSAWHKALLWFRAHSCNPNFTLSFIIIEWFCRRAISTPY